MPDSVPGWAKLFALLSQRAATIDDIVGALTLEHGPDSFKDLSWWIAGLRHQVQGLQRDLATLLPWSAVSTADIESLIAHASVEAREHWHTIKTLISRIPAPSELPELCGSVVVEMAVLQEQVQEMVGETEKSSLAQISAPANLKANLKDLAGQIESAAGAARSLLTRLTRLAQTCETVFHEMDFSFLLDKDRELFTIGYNVGELRPDNSYYDLLASEARLASFVGIAKGDVPQEHWFRMGRQLTLVHRARALISWTGTMFEYLMPLLVMRSYAGTLLDQTYRAVVTRQIEYGEERGVPWGNFRIRLQRARLAIELSVRALWSAWPGTKTRPGPGPGGRALRNDARGGGRSSGSHGQPGAVASGGRTGALRLLRGNRLHGRAATTKPEARPDQSVHGSSSGHEPGGARQCSQ